MNIEACREVARFDELGAFEILDPALISLIGMGDGEVAGAVNCGNSCTGCVENNVAGCACSSGGGGGGHSLIWIIEHDMDE